MESTPTPGSSRRTTRRADRYRQESGVAPSGDLMRRTEDVAPTEESVSAKHAPVSAAPAPAPLITPAPQAQTSPPPVMERPKLVPRSPKKERAGWKMPLWLTVSIITSLIVLLALFTAQSLMNAYLTQREQERQDAYQRVVDGHPIYYKDLIERYAAENNLQPAYVAAIILNESSFRADAESGVGARGLMQIMPSTAEWIAGKLKISGFSFDQMYDAETNIRFGTWYLNYLSNLSRFRGDPVLVTAAYHAGQGEVTGWLSDPGMSQDGVTIELENMMDGPTKRYVGRVTQDYGIYDALYYNGAAAADEGAGGGDALPEPDGSLPALR